MVGRFETDKFNLIIDELYSCYEADISLQNSRYIHPMFYNGTYSDDNSCQPPKPDELMSRDEFVKKMGEESFEYRWNTAFQVLYNYVSRQLK
jgi:hypothetical protein